MAENKGPGQQPEKPFSLERDTPIVRINPDSLITQGFSFIANREVDDSMLEKIHDDSYVVATVRLKEHGIRTEPFDISACKSLKEYVLESLKDGYEVVFLRGTYNPLMAHKKQFTPSRDFVAMFRRFNLGAFFSSKSFGELEQEGFALQGYLPFDRWGKALEDLKDGQRHEKAIQQNTAIAEHIRLNARHGNQVILLRGTINKHGMHDTSTPVVTTLVRPKQNMLR